MPLHTVHRSRDSQLDEHAEIYGFAAAILHMDFQKNIIYDLLWVVSLSFDKSTDRLLSGLFRYIVMRLRLLYSESYMILRKT